MKKETDLTISQELHILTQYSCLLDEITSKLPSFLSLLSILGVILCVQYLSSTVLKIRNSVDIKSRMQMLHISSLDDKR